ncbi:MAG: hypothetical protein LBS19_02305 [Clostridiales bacterium]|jgi:hypothetical protein|nr:hypothetical protein [Clostridiales bacterium]
MDFEPSKIPLIKGHKTNDAAAPIKMFPVACQIIQPSITLPIPPFM